jgi:hypothetical protein
VYLQAIDPEDDGVEYLLENGPGGKRLRQRAATRRNALNAEDRPSTPPSTYAILGMST